MSALSAVLVIVAVACLLMMALLLSVANRSLREMRASIFPIVREEGAVRVRRARGGATIAAVIAAGAAIAFFASEGSPLPGLQVRLPQLPALLPELPQLAQRPPTATPTAEPTPTPTLTLTPQPTATPTDTPTPGVIATDAPLPTATATPEAVSVAPTPLPATPTLAATPTFLPTATAEPSATPTGSAAATPTPTPVPLPTNARLGPLTFATELGADAKPLNPTRVFSNTVARVYAVFPFEGMRKGLLWTRVWYFNGQEFARDEEFWQWGERDYSYVFIKPVGAGEYRLDLLVNNQLLTSGKFTVLGPAAIGGPQTP